MSIRRNITMALGAAAIAAAAGTSATAAETTLRAGVFLPVTVNFGEPFKKFVDHVNAEGKGKVQIRIVGGPEAVPPFELGNAVKSGVLDMAALPPAYYKGQMVEGEASILSPMGFAEQRKAGAWEILNGITNQKMNAQFLAAYGDGVKFHIYLTKAIDSVDDLKGLQLRSSPNYQAFFKSLGATTVQTAPGEVYTALERGTIDGYGWPLWGIQDQGWEKHTAMRVEPGFYNVGVNILINLNKWKSLSDEQRAFLNDMGTWLEAEFPKWREERSGEDLEVQKKAGIKVIDFGPGFEKQANDIYWAELEKASPENIGKLKKILVK